MQAHQTAVVAGMAIAAGIGAKHCLDQYLKDEEERQEREEFEKMKKLNEEGRRENEQKGLGEVDEKCRQEATLADRHERTLLIGLLKDVRLRLALKEQEDGFAFATIEMRILPFLKATGMPITR